ncbi:hypothetical protein CYU57_13905 [Klebsiella pneumoniae]|nr:hypothetical protein CYU57_13905 [Klebsiella pneumoniae]
MSNDSTDEMPVFPEAHDAKSLPPGYAGPECVNMAARAGWAVTRGVSADDHKGNEAGDGVAREAHWNADRGACTQCKIMVQRRSCCRFATPFHL